MKHLILDANNIASLSFFRAKSIMMKEIKEKLDGSNEDELIQEAVQNIKGFGLHLFFNKIHNIIRSNKDYKVLFVWDGRYGSVWRKKENESYKANRTHDGDMFYSTFIDMMNTASDILKSYPVLQFTKQDAEADDLIYSLVKILRGDRVKVVTTDTDMIQLAQQFDGVEVWNPIKKKLHEIPDYDYVLFKSVVGDKSDNIGGVPRYGQAKGKKVAIEGVEVLSDEHQKIVKENIKIIDLSKNPSEPENAEYVKSILMNDLSYDLDQIKKYFFDLRLKQQIDKFGSTAKLLKSLS